QAADLVGAGGLDVVDAVADHPGCCAVERVLAEQAGQQVGLAMAGQMKLVAINGREQAGELEPVENPQGKVLVLGGADEEWKSLSVQLFEHRPHPGKDGVVLP